MSGRRLTYKIPQLLLGVVLIFLGLYGQPKLFAQEILWNKNYQTVAFRPEQAFDHLMRLPSGNLIAFGKSNHKTVHYITPNGTEHQRATIDVYKFSNEGDTLWSINILEPIIQSVGMAKNNDLIYISYIPNTPNPIGCPAATLGLYVLDTNGVVQYSNFNCETTLPEERIPLGMYFENVNEIYFYGIVSNANMFPPHRTAWYIQKFRLGGTQTEWVKYYTPGYSQMFTMHMERLPDKRFVLSGTAGPRVAFLVTDSVGNHTVGDVKFPFADNYNGYCSSGRVMMHPNGGYVSFSTQSYNTSGIVPNYHVSLFNQYDSLLWKKSYHGASGSATLNKINQDGSIIHYRTYRVQFGADSLFHFFEKLDANGNQVWQIRFGNRTNQNVWNPRSVAYLEDESAIFAGSFNAVNIGRIFNIRKISNIGRPFDPANPVSLPREELGNTAINYTLYPNPANERVFVKGLIKQENIRVFDLKGQEVLQGTISPEESLSIEHLPSGLYMVVVGQQRLKVLKR